MRIFSCTSFLSLILLGMFVGCGEKRPPGMPHLYPVSVTVVQEGTPVEGALVTLISEERDLAAWGPGGMTSSNGIASLVTNSKYKGAPAGTFKVVVSKKETEKHPHPEWADLPDGDPKFIQYRNESMKLKTYEYIELKYGQLVETPLSVTITKDSRVFTLDVGKPIHNAAKEQGAR